MQSAGAWQRLLRHVRPRVATPCLLEVGVGPRGTAPPAPVVRGGSVSPSTAPLPIFSVNFDDMSGFEVDYVYRALTYATRSWSSTPQDMSATLLGCSMACSAALHEPPCTAGDAEPAWRHVCDLVMMPDGCATFGWMHNHALDLCWRHHVLGYVADIFQRAPGRLWSMFKSTVDSQVRQAVRMNWRILPVMQWTSTVSEADVTQAITLVRGSLVRPAGTSYELEDEVSVCAAAGGSAVSLSTARTLIHLTEQRTRALPTGTAIALMRMLVCAHAAHAGTANDELRPSLVAAAVRVCTLSRDSECYRLLAWAATLIGADAAGDTTVTEATADALTLTLLDLVAAPGAGRDAQLSSCAHSYILPLCDALLSEEAVLLDCVGAFRSQAVLEVRQSAMGTASSAGGAADSVDAALFGRVLGRATTAAPDRTLAMLVRAVDGTAAPALPWLPGIGVDCRGCWCSLLTHTTLLATHTRAGASQRGGTTQRSPAEAADHALRVNLARRCLHNPDSATAATHYSLLTHLFSAAAAPARRLILVHLGGRSSDDPAAPPPDSPADDAARRAAIGLLFLYPSLPLRALRGGSVAVACAALANPKGAQLACHAGVAECSQNGVVTLSIAKRDAARLSERLQGRERAVLCVVQVMGSTQAAFLLDELPVFLHTLLDSS